MTVGIEFTTFSLIGRCERTGMFGIAIATSEMAVGSRCIHVAPGVGAIVTQASTLSATRAWQEPGARS